MAVQSKYFQLTGQILLEYKTDQYVILRNNTENEYKSFMVYKGVDENQYCLLDENIKHAEYQNNNRFTQFYGGKDAVIEITEKQISTNSPYGQDMYVENTEFQIGTLIKSIRENNTN